MQFSVSSSQVFFSTMSSNIKIKVLNETLEMSFEVGYCATDSLSMKGYPFTPENFHVARDNNSVDKWSPLDPLWIYTFTPADPEQTSTPKKASPNQEPTEEEVTVPANPNQEPPTQEEVTVPANPNQEPQTHKPSTFQHSQQISYKRNGSSRT